MNAYKKLKQRARKGFSLVELVIVIIIIAILAVAVFAGGSAAIKKSQVSRTISDLHNFSVAIEAAMNETPSVANMNKDNIAGAGKAITNDLDMKNIYDAVQKNLAADYKLGNAEAADVSGDDENLHITNGTSYMIFESAKTDAWGNPYYVVFDYGERHAKGQSDFYITVVSAGANAQTNVGSKIESDDVFLLVQYSDGDVSAVTYSVADDDMFVTSNVADGSADYTLVTKTQADTVKKAQGGTLLYAGGADNTSYTGSVLPVNF